MEAIPLRLRPTHTELASGEEAFLALKEWQERSAALGTAVQVLDGYASVGCDPGAPGVSPESIMPSRQDPLEVRPAPRTQWVSAVPSDATRAHAQWPNGVELLGYRITPHAVPGRPATEIMDLYFRLARSAGEDANADVVVARERGDPTEFERFSHVPGDWIEPVSMWRVGAILEDRFVLRPRAQSSGAARFSVGLARGETMLAPVSDTRGAASDGFVLLGPARRERRVRTPRPSGGVSDTDPIASGN